MQFSFELLETDPTGARLGRLTTPHGVIDTPAFMPVGTAGTVKGLTQEALGELGVQILALVFIVSPRICIGRLGGHRTHSQAGRPARGSYRRPGAILTDSGGFQVFSLADLRKVSDEGVVFRSHLDGSEHFLPPEKSIRDLRRRLGSDIAMRPRWSASSIPPITRALRKPWGVRPSGHAAAVNTRASMPMLPLPQDKRCSPLCREERTPICAARARASSLTSISPDTPLAVLPSENRTRSPAKWRPPRRSCCQKIARRYSMGVATLNAGPPFASGSYLAVNPMDCVLPTRNARNGCLFTSAGRVNIKNAIYADDPRPLDADCSLRLYKTSLPRVPSPPVPGE